MSWFTEIAGKAEDFLNKIDQNAAVAITHVQEQSRSSSRPRSKKKTEPQLVPESSAIANIESSQNPNQNGLSSSTISLSDQQNNVAHDMNTGTGSSRAFGIETKPMKKLSPRSLPNSISMPKQPIKPHSSERRDEDLLNYLNSSTNQGLDEVTVLKNELDTQSKEMSLLVKNYKQVQRDYENLKRVHESTLALSSANEVAVESQDKFNAIGMERLENELRSKDELLRNLNARLNIALDQEKHEQDSNNMQNRLEQLELENEQLKDTLFNLEESLENFKEKHEQTTNQVESLKKSKLAVEQEYSSYKDKAKSILKGKDDMIASLADTVQQLRSSDPDAAPIASLNLTSESLQSSELTSLRNERELFIAEISQFRSQTLNLKDEIGRLESDLSNIRKRNSELEDTLKKERLKFRSFQDENLQISQSISSLQLELERSMIERRKLEEKCENCRCSQMPRNVSSSDIQNNMHSSSSFNHFDTDEIEKLRTRIVALSQSLLEKQSLINAISSDKQLLQINVERLEGQLVELRQSSEHFTDCRGSTSSVISTQPLYMSESPWDSNVTLQVKRAYSVVDSLCCQFGMAMRQRPRLRFGFSAYVLLLHLWVFFILFSWTPNSPTDPEIQQK